MYIARYPLNLGTRRVQNGEPVPEAEKWSHTVLTAHIRLGWIEKVDETDSVPPVVEPPKKKSKKKTKKAA